MRPRGIYAFLIGALVSLVFPSSAAQAVVLPDFMEYWEGGIDIDELIEQGRDFDEAKHFLETQLVPKGGRYVHSANEQKLIAGVGTMACEIFDVLPDPDVILVPVGLGSGVCGSGIVAKAVRPQTVVIGVQASGADAVASSWKSGRRETTNKAGTWAEGMATRVPADMTLDSSCPYYEIDRGGICGIW